MQVIELEAYPDHEFRTDLGETEFLIRLHYLERFDTWLFDLLDSDETPIVEGLAVVLGKPLLSQLVDARRPEGDLVFTALGPITNDLPGFEDFTARVVLHYLTAEEITALA
jgi:hypothetical protein